MAEALSQANFAAIIRQSEVDEAAAVIWQLVAAYIAETENRIIDAEFAKNEAEQSLPKRPKIGMVSGTNTDDLMSN